MLWAEKTGRVTLERTEAMRWGALLEPVIKAELQERGYEVKPAPAGGFTDEARPWLVGHPDGFTEVDGWPAILEVKTASTWASRDWHEAAGAPLAYLIQCHHYMELTGCGLALLACLVGGQRLELRVVNRDDVVTARMIELEAELVEYVTRDEPPPPDGSASAKDALAALYPTSVEGETVRLDVDGWREYEALKDRREQRDAIDRQVAELEQRLKARMGDAETAISPHDDVLARWTSYERKGIDLKRLRRSLPAIADEYETTKQLRRFTIE
jgi:predicted phage-related endonuclease